MGSDIKKRRLSNYSQDLEPRESTWKGILLSLIVIGLVFGGICLSAFFIQPSKLFIFYFFRNIFFPFYSLLANKGA